MSSHVGIIIIGGVLPEDKAVAEELEAPWILTLFL
jgi:hypothetical protein